MHFSDVPDSAEKEGMYLGQESDAMMDYLDDNERFADLYNGGCFDGQEMVKPEELEEGSEVYKEDRGRKTIPRIRDLKKRLKSGGRLKVLAIENQDDVDYTMPWRHMNYDSLEYVKQIRNIKKQNLHKGKNLPMTGAEFKCGLYSTDRLAPAFTVCVYTGKEKWTGPRSLKDMMDFGEDSQLWEQLFSDYHMKLICINELEDFNHFKTSLKELFMAIACRQDKNKLKKLMAENEAYQNIDSETAEAIGVMVGMKSQVVKQKKEGTGVNMCEALKGLLDDSKAEGRIEGKGEGETLKLISQVRKKYLKGKSLEVIADEVEESPEVIEPILALVREYPEDTNEEIYQRMNV